MARFLFTLVTSFSLCASECPPGLDYLSIEEVRTAKGPKLIRLGKVDPRPNFLDVKPRPELLFGVATVDTEGKVCGVHFLSKGDRGAEEEVAQSYLKSRYEPASFQGKVKAAHILIRAELHGLKQSNFMMGDSPSIAPPLEEASRLLNRPETSQQGLAALEKLARTKDATAQGYLALQLYKGELIPSDVSRAVELAKRAANLEDRFGHYVLGLAHEEGNGVKSDLKKAALHFEHAALGGFVPALVRTAQMFRMGQGVKADPDRAAIYYRSCAMKSVGSCEGPLVQLLMKDSLGEALAWAWLLRDRDAASAANLISILEAKVDAPDRELARAVYSAIRRYAR